MKHAVLFCYFLIVTQAFHEQLDEWQLQHFFGVRTPKKVPEYTIAAIDKGYIGSQKTVAFNLGDHTETFVIEDYSNKIIGEGFHIINRNENGSQLIKSSTQEHCIFRGTSLTTNGTSIAISGCGTDMRGIVMANNGDHFLIQPTISNSDQHVIHKRNADFSQHEHAHTCLFDKKNDPHPEDQCEISPFGGKKSRLSVMKLEEVTIELAVFADDAMWRHFSRLYGNEADSQMHKFIMAVVNNIDALYARRRLQPRVNIKIVRYEVMKVPPAMLSKSVHNVGDVDKLLDAFCSFQNAINPTDDSDPRHWDHALLFSGYDLYRDGLRTVAGYAPVKGMCNGRRSCTLNEGLDFGSVFVVTHEMGHSLGMYHDGDNNCDLHCCIMSPSVGAGKTDWSSCSNREFNIFLSKLGSRGRSPNCLTDVNRNARSSYLMQEEFPGQKYTLDEQCATFHGDCWVHELKDGQAIEDVCNMVWCGNGEGLIRTAHPAMEGTYCGPNKWCVSGQCRAAPHNLRPIDGSWSLWNDFPGKTCSKGCSQCDIAGQIQLKRSVRSCTMPNKNNGGKKCVGDDVRGFACSNTKCYGKSIKEYASDYCRKLRDDPDLPNPEYSGLGLQFQLSMCKIWCHMSHSNQIRTVANFPDGTPCGDNSYCIKGICRPLICENRIVAEDEGFCPTKLTKMERIGRDVKTFNTPQQNKNEANVQFSIDSNIHIVENDAKYIKDSTTIISTTTTTTMTTTTQQTVNINQYGWEQWAEWSACYGIKCGGPGIQVRTRKCVDAEKCYGPRAQKKPCMFVCHSTFGLLQAFRKYRKNIRRSQSAETSFSIKVQNNIDVPRAVAPRLHTEMPRIKRKYFASSTFSRYRRALNNDERKKFYEKTGYSIDEIDDLHLKTKQHNSRNVSPTELFSRFSSKDSFIVDNTITTPQTVHYWPQQLPFAGWSRWSEWSVCHPTCTGFRSRSRLCFVDANKCIGPTSEAMQCTPQTCNVNRVPMQGYNSQPPMLAQQSYQFYPQNQQYYGRPSYYYP